jgi:4-phytase/acid phosphatase
MAGSFFSRRSRRRLVALGSAILISAVCLAGPIGSAGAADSDIKAAAPDATQPIITVIFTRHGVRSISNIPVNYWNTPENYKWAPWAPVEELFLTEHGYQLMTLMGGFYVQDAGIKVDCDHQGVFVYADKAQRTLLTAQALVKGLCPKVEIPIFHEKDTSASDPIFNGAAWLAGRIDAGASSRAVAAVAGSPPSTIVMSHAEDFSMFQRILDRRCDSQKSCAPVATGASTIEHKIEGLWELGGPLAKASTYAEDVFLEYAQCRPTAEIAPSLHDAPPLDDETLRTDLQAGMRLHVLAYGANARNAYNPLVRGGTLLAHVVAMLDQKAGREVLKHVVTPAEVTDKTTLVIFSGHDTQLGALGGILDAHWSPDAHWGPEGGIVPDDMPPGSALVFDLFRDESGEYGVRLRFAAMTLDQFRTNVRIDNDSIHMTNVTYAGCRAGGCIVPLAQFESLALTLQAQGLVDNDWPSYSHEPPPPEKLENPEWTEAKCKSAP